MNHEILQMLGLTPAEIKAYLALLKAGPCTTGPVSEISGVSRSKLYGIIGRLEKKGLASHIERSGVLYYLAVEPRRILDHLKEKEEQFRKLQGDFMEFLPQLEAFHSHSRSKQSINVHHGMMGLKAAHERTYEKLNSGEEYYVLGVPNLPQWFGAAYWQRDQRRREQSGIGCKMLFNSDAPKSLVDNRNSFEGCDARYMPGELKTPAYFTLYKDTTLITIPAPEPVSIEIVSPDVAKSFKSYFDEFWKKSKSFK
jgi:predicted transcriptional regulator